VVLHHCCVPGRARLSFIRLNLLLVVVSALLAFFFFFNDTAPTEIYTLSLHDALPILEGRENRPSVGSFVTWEGGPSASNQTAPRSEEHTSELQSLTNLVCRLLLEKKKKLHPHPYTRPTHPPPSHHPHPPPIHPPPPTP